MWARPERWKSVRTAAESRSSCPSTIPRASAASGGSRPPSSPASARRRIASTTPATPPRRRPVDRTKRTAEHRVSAPNPRPRVPRAQALQLAADHHFVARLEPGPALASRACPRDAGEDGFPGASTARQPHERAFSSGARRARCLEQRCAAGELVADQRVQRGRVQRGEARVRRGGSADQRHRGQRRHHRSQPHCAGRQQADCRDQARRRQRPVPDKEPGDQRPEDQVPRVGACLRRDQTVTWSRSAAMRFAPMPGMRSSSLTDPKPPCCAR